MQQRANPGFLAAEIFSRVLYGAHPASRVSPTLAALDKTTGDRLAAFHRTHYVPDHAGMAISGDISMAEARTIVEAKLGAWKKSGTPASTVSEPAPTSGSKIHFIARPNSVQTNLIVGAQAIARTDPDYDVLRVMNTVIGGGPTGRLFMHLREEKGYTYGACSSLGAPMHRGDWSASTNVRTEVTGPALRDLLAEIGRLRDERVPDRELADAQANDGGVLRVVAGVAGAAARPVRDTLAISPAGGLLGSLRRPRDGGDARTGAGGRAEVSRGRSPADRGRRRPVTRRRRR